MIKIPKKLIIFYITFFMHFSFYTANIKDYYKKCTKKMTFFLQNVIFNIIFYIRSDIMNYVFRQMQRNRRSPVTHRINRHAICIPITELHPLIDII